MKDIYLIALLLVACCSGCIDVEDELRREVVENNITTEITPPGTSYPVTATNFLRLTGTAVHGSYFTIQEVTSDEIFVGQKGSDWNTEDGLIALHQHTYTPDNNSIRIAWIQIYNSIEWINSELTNQTREEYVAMLRGVRAYLYWRLLDLFGSVKIVVNNSIDPPQSTPTEVFDFVERELLDILGIDEVHADMELTENTLQLATEEYDLNAYGALGILAKLYLNAETYTGIPHYEEAAAAAAFIIDSGHYQLCGVGCSVANLGQRPGVTEDPATLEGYAAVFAPNNEGNPENVFTIRHEDSNGSDGMFFAQMNLHPGSQFSWQLDEQPWNGYATLEEFYNGYAAEDQRKSASFLVGPQLDFTGSAILDYQSEDDDLQLNYQPKVDEIAPNSGREAGARAKKFSFQMKGKRGMNNDFPIVRLGELYLIRAEARARLTGDWIAAEADVNILRARAGVPEYNGELTEEEFLAERGREMFHEAARRTDLIRFGRYNDAWWEKPASAEFRNVFPIPQTQIDAGGLTQNPGY